MSIPPAPALGTPTSRQCLFARSSDCSGAVRVLHEAAVDEQPHGSRKRLCAAHRTCISCGDRVASDQFVELDNCDAVACWTPWDPDLNCCAFQCDECARFLTLDQCSADSTRCMDCVEAGSSDAEDRI